MRFSIANGFLKSCVRLLTSQRLLRRSRKVVMPATSKVGSSIARVSARSRSERIAKGNFKRSTPRSDTLCPGSRGHKDGRHRALSARQNDRGKSRIAVCIRAHREWRPSRPTAVVVRARRCADRCRPPRGPQASTSRPCFHQSPQVGWMEAYGLQGEAPRRHPEAPAARWQDVGIVRSHHQPFPR
jgi:hypothetical protein